MRISDWSSDVCSSDLAVIKGLQANANILRFHDCSSRIPSNDAKEPKWPAPISAWKPDRPSKSFKLRAARITSESRGSRPYITLSSDECSVGTECVSTCESRGGTDNAKKKKKKI